MMNSDLLIKVSEVLPNLNIRQREIATQLLNSPEYSILDYNGDLCIRTKNGDIFNFVLFIKQKCNCN
jgi:hypothetical protein